MKGIVANVFTKLKEHGITKPDNAQAVAAIAQYTGLSRQQVANAVHQLSVKSKMLGRILEKQPDGGRFYRYWVQREEPIRRRRNRIQRAAHSTDAGTSRTNGGGEYKISITGDDLIIEKKVPVGTLNAVMAALLQQ